MLLLFSGCSGYTKKAPEFSGACDDVLSGTTIVMELTYQFCGSCVKRD
jgi:hypothetical protein